MEWEEIEKEWEVVRDSMKVCAEEVSGKKRVGGMRRNQIKSNQNIYIAH